MTPPPAQYQGLRVEEQRTKLFAPHNRGELTFLYPVYELDTYANVGLSIVRDNLKKPTMAETASLVYAAFNSDDKYSQEIKDIMNKGLLWAFTGILYAKEGTFIQDDPEIRNGMPFMNLDDLIQKLNFKDPSVRFVPFGYLVGGMDPLQLEKNPYVIALAGEEGAGKLARVAEKFRVNPYLLSLESVKNETYVKNETRVSSLGSRGLDRRFDVSGNLHGKGRIGRAFGVLKETQK